MWIQAKQTNWLCFLYSQILGLWNQFPMWKDTKAVHKIYSCPVLFCKTANRPGNIKQMLTFNFRGMYDMHAYSWLSDIEAGSPQYNSFSWYLTTVKIIGRLWSSGVWLPYKIYWLKHCNAKTWIDHNWQKNYLVSWWSSAGSTCF
jgi:hypothetical protein